MASHVDSGFQAKKNDLFDLGKDEKANTNTGGSRLYVAYVIWIPGTCILLLEKWSNAARVNLYKLLGRYEVSELTTYSVHNVTHSDMTANTFCWALRM